MSFDWWHPECTATRFIIVTIVEIHTLIFDHSVSTFLFKFLTSTTFKEMVRNILYMLKVTCC